MKKTKCCGYVMLFAFFAAITVFAAAVIVKAVKILRLQRDFYMDDDFFDDDLFDDDDEEEDVPVGTLHTHETAGMAQTENTAEQIL